jgi:uncharacterized protein YjiS (DUF1127 family)
MEWLGTAWQAFREAQKRRALARALEGVDARTLKDIGLEELANEQRRREILHAAVLRLGAC